MQFHSSMKQKRQVFEQNDENKIIAFKQNESDYNFIKNYKNDSFCE